MRISTGIDDEAARFGARGLNEIDHFAFIIALQAQRFHAMRLGAAAHMASISAKVVVP